MDIEKIILLETSIDHLTGEELGNALAVLNDMSDVLDAICLNGIGKKNRPAFLLQVLCRPEHEAAVATAVFRHTHALGLRRQMLERYVAPRKCCSMNIAEREIAAKAHEIEGATYMRPEADALAGLARELGLGMPGLRFREDHND